MAAKRHKKRRDSGQMSEVGKGRTSDVGCQRAKRRDD